jgi:hypothetical protein
MAGEAWGPLVRLSLLILTTWGEVGTLDTPILILEDRCAAQAVPRVRIPPSPLQNAEKRMSRPGLRGRVFESARAFVERKQQEGKSKREALRCLKRHLARRVFALLQARPSSETAGDPTRDRSRSCSCVGLDIGATGTRVPLSGHSSGTCATPFPAGGRHQSRYLLYTSLRLAPAPPEPGDTDGDREGGPAQQMETR